MIEQSEAARALDSVTQARRKASALRDYAKAGNALIVWGLVWLVCNLVGQFAPRLSGLCWSFGVAGAVLFGLVSGSRRSDPRILGTIATAIGFGVLILAITRGSAAAQNAIVSAIVAASYIVLGIWNGARFAWLGLVVAGMIVLGWFVFPGTLLLWLGLGGGGSLILAGLWLRRA